MALGLAPDASQGCVAVDGSPPHGPAPVAPVLEDRRRPGPGQLRKQQGDDVGRPRRPSLGSVSRAGPHSRTRPGRVLRWRPRCPFRARRPARSSRSQALLRAEATVRKRLALELEREGVTAAGFSVLVVLTTAGGSLELKTLRRRFGWSKANATEVTGTLARRGFVSRRRAPEDRRVVIVDLDPTGRSLVERLFPAHSERVTEAFGKLDESEKRTFSELCPEARRPRPRSGPRC